MVNNKISAHVGDMDARLKEMEKSLEEVQRTITTIVAQHDKLLENIPDAVKNNKDSRKLKLYAIYTSNKKLTYQQMADEICVSLRTVKYWIQEMRDQGLIE